MRRTASSARASRLSVRMTMQSPMVLIGSISFLETHRSSNICAPSQKSNLLNILDTNKSVVGYILDTLLPPPPSPATWFSEEIKCSFDIRYFMFIIDLVVHLHYCNCCCIPPRLKRFCVYVELILISFFCHFLVAS